MVSSLGLPRASMMITPIEPAVAYSVAPVLGLVTVTATMQVAP